MTSDALRCRSTNRLLFYTNKTCYCDQYASIVFEWWWTLTSNWRWQSSRFIINALNPSKRSSRKLLLQVFWNSISPVYCWRRRCSDRGRRDHVFSSKRYHVSWGSAGAWDRVSVWRIFYSRQLRRGTTWYTFITVSVYYAIVAVRKKLILFTRATLC